MAATWDGGGADDEYSTALNWSDDLVPTSSTNSTQDISGAYTVERTINSTSGRTFVKNGAVLNVTSGVHSDAQAGNTIRNFVGDGTTGTVNLTGASTSYGIGHLLAIAHSSNSNGTFNHSDGALNVSRGSNALIGGYGGIFTRGHSMSIGGNSGNTNVTGLYEISGGSLNTRAGVAVGNNGTFSIVGSSATEIRLGGSGDDAGWFALSADGTLKASLDVGGITPIYIEDLTNTSTTTPEVELQAGSVLDLSFINSVVNGTWTLIEVENADIVDNGLALAPGVDSNWSFAIDNSGTNGLLTVTYQNGTRSNITVNSLAQLVQCMGYNNTDITMAPGIYQIGPDDVTSGLLDDGDTYLLHFSGSDSTFDFTGVKFEIDTYVYRTFGNNEVRAIEISGEDLKFYNLTMEDIGTARPGRTALAVKLGGWRNLVEGFTITIRGSVPYGYGDIFGKGAGPVIGHKKHSGILIGGDDNTLRDATLYHRAYGHGIFVQGAINTLIEGCYVEGELSTTDRVLAEAGTGSRADNVAFQTVWGFPLRAGNTFSLQEDGIRTYNTGNDQTGTERNTENITVRDCTIYRMRSGVTIGFTNGTQDVDNCVAIQCENAYWIQNGSIMNSAADSQVGFVLTSPYGNSGTKTVDVTIVRNDNEGQEDNRILAYIAGPNDNITFRSSASNTGVNQNTKLVVGGPRDSYRYETTDVGMSASNGVINNLTNYPVELSSLSSNITGSSWGAVTDNGSSNNLTSTTVSTVGGYAMMQTIQAEDYSAESGTSQLATNNGGMSVGDIQDGDWIRFNDVIFGSGPKYIEALVAGGTNGGSIDVRLDSTTGTLLGTLNANGSAIPENWVTETTAIAHTQGIHDVYLVFTGSAGDLLELDHFKFTERNNDPYNRDSYNLIAHYKFDEGTGSTATDATGNGYDGTISNATWTTGAEQGALAFDGSSSTVDIPGSLLDNMEEEITVSLWVYGDDTQPLAGSVFYAQSAGGDRILNAHLPYSDSNVFWDSGNPGGYDRLQKLATTDQFEGQWNHWTFVKNTSQGDMLIFNNGELFAASDSNSEEIGDAIIASIGSRLGGNNYFGTIDDVKFYNAALSRNEVKELYDSYFTNLAPGFIADPITKSNAASGIAYTDTINNSAFDPDGDTLTYSKLSGPTWLNVATDGSLSGTPDSGDIGLNVFTIQVDAIGGSDTATLNITVDVGTYTLTYTASANGSISGTSPQVIDEGSNGTAVTAVAAANYSFVDWSDGSTANPRTDLNVTADINVTANFAIDTYTLTYTAGANGSITGTSPQTIDHGDNGSAVTAVAAANYSFVDWSDGSTDNPRTDLSITDDITVTANFTIDTYTLTYTAGANGSITGTTPQTIDHGADGTAVTAVAEANYSFVDWSDGSTANPRTDLSITADVAVTANFALTQTELDNWRFTHFGTYNNTGNAADDFDADFDGVLNLIEYATGTDPMIPSASPFVLRSTGSGSSLEVSFNRILDPSLVYTVEGTNNLFSTNWDLVWTGSGTSAGEIIVPESSWSNDSNYFLRLSVSESEE